MNKVYSILSKMLLITLGMFLAIGILDGWTIELICSIVFNLFVYIYYQVNLHKCIKSRSLDLSKEKPIDIPQDLWDALKNYYSTVEKENKDK